MKGIFHKISLKEDGRKPVFFLFLASKNTTRLNWGLFESMVEIIEIASEESLQPASYTTGAYFVVNFGFEDAIKILPYYKSLSKYSVDSLFINFKDAGINLRPDDILSMLHLVLLDLTHVKPDVNTYFVGSAGFTEDSFDFLKRNILKINAFDYKKIYLCCFTLPSNKSYFGTLK